MLKQALQLKKARSRVPRVLSVPNRNPPKGIEREYVRELNKYVRTMRLLFLQIVQPAITRLKARYEAQFRVDSADEIDDAFKRLKIVLAEEYSEVDIRRIALRTGTSVSQFNRRILEDGLRRVVGVDVFVQDVMLTEVMESYAYVNTRLIQGLSEDTLNKIQESVLRNYAQGGRWENLTEEIGSFLDPGGKAFTRAASIARDQTNKLNGQLTQMRQTNLGVRKYVWRTALDERVRESHLAKEGRVYSWDDPPADTGHPGEDFGCRCIAEPVLDSLLEGDE